MGSSGPLYIALANRARDLQPGSVRTSLHYQAKVCGCATTKATEAPFPGVKKGTFSGTLYKNLEHTKGLKSILLLKSERKKDQNLPQFSVYRSISMGKLGRSRLCGPTGTHRLVRLAQEPIERSLNAHTERGLQRGRKVKQDF